MAGSSLFFPMINVKYFVVMSLWPRTIRILISNWPRTQKFSQFFKIQTGKTFSYHGHALVTLYVQFLCSDWSKFDRWVHAEKLCSILKVVYFDSWIWQSSVSTSQGPEEMCLSLEHQNPSKTSEKMFFFFFYRVTASLHILYTANQETECSQNRLTVFSVALRETYCVPARLWLAVIDFQSGEQQSRSESDKKRRNRLQ